jgi:hypothetical protein
MTTTINCFGLGNNVTNYIQSHVGSKYNLISNDFPTIFNSELMGAREYLHMICTEMSKKYCSQIIIGIHSIELDCLLGYPGAFINTIKNRGKLKRFSETFKGETGILKFSVMFFTSHMDHYYYKNTVRGTVCTSKIEDIFSKFNSKKVKEKHDMMNEPLKQLVHFMRNQNIVPIRNVIRTGSEYDVDKKSDTKPNIKGSIPLVRPRGNTPTPIIRSRGNTPVVQLQSIVDNPIIPRIPSRGSTPNKVHALYKVNTNVQQKKPCSTYFPSIVHV